MADDWGDDYRESIELFTDFCYREDLTEWFDYLFILPIEAILFKD